MPAAAGQPQNGGIEMKCPFCAYLESKVVDSRPAEEGSQHPPPPGVPVLPQALHHL